MGLSNDDRFREAVRSHVEFGSRVAQQNSWAEAEADPHRIRRVPQWQWPQSSTGPARAPRMFEHTSQSIRDSYDRLADEYTRRLFGELRSKPLDRQLRDRFAADVAGLGAICAMGCGPGQVARYLHDAGATGGLLLLALHRQHRHATRA